MFANVILHVQTHPLIAPAKQNMTAVAILALRAPVLLAMFPKPQATSPTSPTPSTPSLGSGRNQLAQSPNISFMTRMAG